jgi:hypothetical protein
MRSGLKGSCESRGGRLVRCRSHWRRADMTHFHEQEAPRRKILDSVDERICKLVLCYGHPPMISRLSFSSRRGKAPGPYCYRKSSSRDAFRARMCSTAQETCRVAKVESQGRPCSYRMRGQHCQLLRQRVLNCLPDVNTSRRCAEVA